MENQDLNDDDETIDPADFVATEQRQSMRQVMSNLDADPEKAARAQKLGEATGIPPALIHGDLENFEQQHKARLTAQLFDENRFLKDYVNSHPMAAAVSNDDYGQLDAISDKVGKIGKQSVLSRAYADFNEGAGTQPFGDWFTKEVGPEYAASHPVTSTLYTLLGLPFELPARTISGGLKAAGGFLEQGYTQITGDEQGGKRFARDIVGMAEYKLLSPGHAPSILAANKELLTKAHEALQASEPYLRAGEEPPVGIHPEIDKLKIDQAKVDRDNLKEALTEAQGSATRERSPELFANFIKQHTDAKISVSFDAVQKLYGDKQPHPEDGLLGWSPDIAEQYRQAAATGGDIEIPLSEWLAKVDPKVANELHDDVRMRPGGVTVNEGKDLIKNHAMVEAFHGSPYDFEAFSMDKIGTGEGAQAYGHGLYFAENPEVAGQYAKIAPRNSTNAQFRAQGALDDFNGNRQAAAARLRELASDDPVQSRKRDVLDAAALLESDEWVPERNTYRVRIHANKEDFLDWDKPFKDQHPKVQEATREVAAERLAAMAEARKNLLERGTRATDRKLTDKEIEIYSQPVPNIEDLTGEQIYKYHGLPAITQGEGFAKSSKALAERGIPGIKYLDQGSRRPPDYRLQELPKEIAKLKAENADPELIASLEKELADHKEREANRPSESYNYVLFDDKLVEITHKNDVAVKAVRNQASLHPFTNEQMGQLSKDPFHTPYIEGQQILSISGFDDKLHTIRSVGSSTLKTLMPKFDFSRSAGEIGEHIKTIADTILKAAGDTPVHILSDLEFDKLGEPDTAAFYDPKTHKIAIRNSSWQEDGPRILLHEAIHAATSRVLYANPDKLDRVSTLMLDIANKMPDLAEKYGYKDEHEFLAEAITDREFQARLADIDVSPDLAKAMGLDKPNATMWDAVIAYIRDLLGVPPGAVSALEAALRLTQETAETKLTAEDKAWLKSYKDAMPKAAKQGELDVTRQEDLAAFKANAIGMTVEQYKKYMGLIEKQKAEDAAYQLEQAKAEIAKRQTKEWKAAAASMRPDVKNDIATRPDIASANFFANGELYGEKVGKPKLRADLLSEEQKVGLPKEYLAKEGLNPDDVAGLFGYPSGSALIERLKQLEAARGDMPLKEFVEKQVDAEVSARMEKEHGNLDKNILDEAKDHVIGNTQMDLLHEETLALGMKAGSKMTFTKEDIKAWVKDQFGKTQVGSVSSDKFLSEAGKAGRAAELGLMEDNAAEAFRQKQRQYIAMRLADESRKFEKEKARFETTAKQFAKREVASVPQEYTNFIHDILLKVGQPVRRSIQDLQQSIDLSGFKDLESFVESKEADLREVPVAEFLYNDNFRKPIEQLTTEEFRAVHDSIKALIKNGRDERQVIKAGEAADLDIVRQQMIEELQTFKEKKYNASETMGDKIKHVARTYLVSHLQLESLFNRWDRGDPRGVFTQYVMRGLTSASNFEAALERKYSRLLGDIADKANLKELVDNNIFIDPLSRTKENPEGYPIERFNRKNLRAVLQNVGNKSNLDKLARGYKLKPEAIMDWLNQHATKEDWDWAQKQGEIFAEMKKESDVMYRNMTGIEPESIQIDPVQTVHGEYKGWYHPVVYHSIWEGQSKRLMGGDALEQNNYVRATTPRGYTKQRSGYAAPMSLDLDATPSRMKQMIHDIAFRPEVINASKIFYDKDIRAAITKHYGKEYRDLLVPYLRDVANSANFRSDAEAVGARTLEWFRQNIIASLIGFNPGTVMKHGPTAAINSLTEVGPINFAKAVKGLFSVNEATGDTNWSFAMNTSEELARRHRHYVETFTGAQEKVLQKPTFRDTMIKLGSYPVAMSDLLSAVPTWLAQYEKSMRDGVDHGEAMFMADRSVRRAHGSSVTTNRPAVMRGGPLAQWTTSLYGFFSHILNRQYELMWKASDTLGMAKEGNYADAAKEVPHLAWGLFSYVIFPALIEEMVTPISNDEHESWGKKSAKFLAKGLSSSWIGVRDVAQAILTSRDPASGLLGTTFKSVTDLTRDMSKTAPMSKQHAGSVIQHGVTAFGALTGLTNATEGRAAKFIYNYSTGQEKPKTMTHFWNGLRHGTMKERK